MSRRLTVKIWLVIGFLAIGFIFLSKEKLTKDYRDFEKIVGVTTDNLSYELMPPRTAAFGVENKEIELKVNFSPVFDKFTDRDWQDLWEIIYGIYSEPDYDNERLPSRKRQLTIPEMQQELKRSFQHPFEYFSQQHWQHFWGVLKIKE